MHLNTLMLTARHYNISTTSHLSHIPAMTLLKTTSGKQGQLLLIYSFISYLCTQVLVNKAYIYKPAA